MTTISSLSLIEQAILILEEHTKRFFIGLREINRNTANGSVIINDLQTRVLAFVNTVSMVNMVNVNEFAKLWDIVRATENVTAYVTRMTTILRACIHEWDHLIELIAISLTDPFGGINVPCHLETLNFQNGELPDVDRVTFTDLPFHTSRLEKEAWVNILNNNGW